MTKEELMQTALSITDSSEVKGEPFAVIETEHNTYYFYQGSDAIYYDSKSDREFRKKSKKKRPRYREQRP